MERMAQQPHHAGSPMDASVAQYALGQFRSFGLDAHIEDFEALIPYPTTRVVELTAPIKYDLKLKEPPVAGDPYSAEPGGLPTYNAYSASGDVTGQLVYVNQGIPADYEYLAKQGIDVKGKIVIARTAGGRGIKPKVAYEHGAIGCIIYSDPKDDGYYQGDTYPKGALRPPDGVQRGSVMDMPMAVGDPLSPGWASEKGSRRLTGRSEDVDEDTGAADLVRQRYPAAGASGGSGGAGKLARSARLHVSHWTRAIHSSHEARLRLVHVAAARRRREDPGQRISRRVDRLWKPSRRLGERRARSD